MGIFGGIKNMVGAVGDVVTAPLRLATGDLGAIGDVVQAPFKLAGGAIETAVGTATLPLKIAGTAVMTPFMLAQATGGTQAGMMRYMQSYPMRYGAPMQYPPMGVPPMGIPPMMYPR